LFLLVLSEENEAVKNWTLRAGEGWLPPNWAELAASWIFIPAILIDGILYDCDHYLYGISAGDFLPYDSVAMMALDTLLFIKFGCIDTLEAYQINYVYKIRSIFYAGCEFIYSIVLVFLFIFIVAIDLQQTGQISVSVSGILVIIVALLHPVFCRFTSMCVQGIKSVNNSKRIRSAPKVRLAALNFYVRWFWFHPVVLLLNLAFYGATFYLYISIWGITGYLAPQVEDPAIIPEVFLQGCLLALLILSNIFTVFYMVNLAYALLKRLGTFLSKCCGFNCAFPFDCSTYAKAMNQGLQECGASFRMNVHMECS